MDRITLKQIEIRAAYLNRVLPESLQISIGNTCGMTTAEQHKGSTQLVAGTKREVYAYLGAFQAGFSTARGRHS